MFLKFLFQLNQISLLRSPQDGLIVENMHDRPYTVCPGPEVTAVMTAISAAVRRSCPHLALGVQVLSAANQQAIAVALAAGNRNDSHVITVVCYGIYSLQIVHCTNIDTMKNET